MSHTRETEHYGLPLYDGGDIINPLTDFNNANSAIDEALYDANQRSVSANNTAEEAKDIAEGYDGRVTQAINTANDAITLANNTQDMIAEDFDPNKDGGYQVGDFVIYNGKLYRFINAHTGAWDASDVQTSPVLIEAIGEVVDEGKQAINDAVADAEEEIAGQTEKVTKTQAMIAKPFDANKSDGYAVDDVVTYADKLYKFTSAHSGAWTGLDVEQIDVEQQVTEMKQSFQVGVDTIYDAITGRGVQPSGSTPSDCATAINTMYSPESYTNYGTDQYNTGRSQGRTDVGGTFQAGQIFSVSDESSTSYSVEANHYYLFIGTATSDTTGITINSGATLVGQYSTRNDAQNNMIAIVALVKTTSTTVALRLTSGVRGVIANVKLGLCS